MYKVIAIIGLFLFPVVSYATCSTYGDNFLTSIVSCTEEGTGDCTYAFDENANTLWNSGNEASFPVDLTVQLGGDSNVLNRIIYNSYYDMNGPYSKNIDVLGSANGADWTQIARIQIPSSTTDKLSTTFTTEFATNTATGYDYYKFSTADNWGSYKFGLAYAIEGYDCLDGESGSSTVSTSSMPYTEQFFSFGTLLLHALWVLMVAFFVHKKLS